MNLTLCTAGPRYKDLLPIAKAAGLDPSPYGFVRQQDVPIPGTKLQAFPRVWSGLNHRGQHVTERYNGGEPGRHDHAALVSGFAALRAAHPGGCILDLEPENWQKWLATGTPQQAIDALDVLRSACDAAGAAALAFALYPTSQAALAVGAGEWVRSMPLVTPDAYWYDRPGDGAPWTPDEYRSHARAALLKLAPELPRRRVRPFFSLCTSGQYRPMTIDELTVSGQTWREMGVYNGLVWAACDSDRDIDEARTNLTAQRVAALAGRSAA